MADEARPVQVSTAFVEEKSVPLEVHATGTVEPLRTITVRPQVGGVLERVLFTEGDDVREGQVLFEIDRRPLEAELKRAESERAQYVARLQNADRQARRSEDLIRSGLATQSQYDDLRTAADVLRATVDTDTQLVEAARLQWEHATIRSPITGRTGGLLVHAGNVVRVDDTPLVSINQIQPIQVRFPVPAMYLPDVRKSGGSAGVRVLPSREREREVRGVLSFVDNAVNTDTGTVLCKARFENQDGALWPGQFADVVMSLRADSHAVTVPSMAVQSGQDGPFVFVVKPDMTVEARNVEVQRSYEGWAVVTKGVAVGEQLVADSLVRLAPGSRIEVRSARKSSADGAKP